MTSNVGSNRILDYAGDGGAGYAVMRATVLDELRRQFRPEFLNRVDEIVVFQALSEVQLERSSTFSWIGCAGGWRTGASSSISRTRPSGIWSK